MERAVEAAGGNLSLAAKQLGVSRNTLYRRLRWNERSSC
jgi:sigma-54 dependent transcriptional regulator, acetoin dehydrogenase operon transcriptional activator AcoR